MLVEAALERGWDVRVGLADTLELPDGSVAPGDARLVSALVAVAGERGSRR